MGSILAIDPGSESSGWVMFDDGRVREHGKDPNEALLARIVNEGWSGYPLVVIEWTAPRGMPASAQLFEALWWAGRFTEAASRWTMVERIERKAVVRHLTGSQAGRDSNVRAALIDRFGGVGGKAAAIGVKASPGPLYGVKADVWAALAVAVTWADLHERRTP